MRIRLDSEACQGHNRCYQLAGELFDVDEEGYAVLRVAEGEATDGVYEGEVPAGLEDKAILAAENCPEFAIEVDE